MPDGAADESSSFSADDLQRVVEAMQSRSSVTGDLPQLSPGAHEAVKAALRLLAHRMRSAHELRQRLQAREHSEEDIEEALARISAWGLLDDAEFAREWVRGRSSRRGKASGVLKRELREKGVGEPEIAAALSQLDAGTERVRAQELVRARLERSEPVRSLGPERGKQMQALRRRLVAYLQRRGFPSEMALGVVDSELSRHLGH